MSKRTIDYEIKMQTTQSFLRGKVQVSSNQTLEAIRDEIQGIHGFRENQLVVQSPQTKFLDPKILLIILHEKRNSQHRKYSEVSSNFFEEESIIQKNQSYNFIEQEPQLPPKVIGKVRQCYRIFSCFTSQKMMILNFEALKFCYPNDQKQFTRVLPLKKIQQIKPYRKKEYFFIKITTNDQNIIDLRFINKQTCKQWLNYFKTTIQYNDYLEERRHFSRNDSFSNFIKTLILNENSNIIKLEDSTMISKKDEQEEKILKVQEKSLLRKMSKNIIGLSDFNITNRIGSGAFSVVFKAECKRDNKVYALKQMNKDNLLYRDQMKYALTQLKILKMCHQCPFTIELGYAFQTQNNLYFALKYLGYGTLKQLIQEEKTLSFKIAFQILCEIVIAIEYLHGLKILYRDMKPQNIMLGKDGHIRLIDFGLSIQLNSDDQFADSFVGTPLYLAPERLEGSGKINYKADIYGVGCIFYFMLHGKAPFQAESLPSIIYNIKNTTLQIRSDISKMAKLFIQDTLQKKTEKRLNHMSSHPLFEGVNWKKIIKKEHSMLNPKKKIGDYIPVKNCNDRDYSEENYPNKKIADWYFP